MWYASQPHDQRWTLLVPVDSACRERSQRSRRHSGRGLDLPPGWGQEVELGQTPGCCHHHCTTSHRGRERERDRVSFHQHGYLHWRYKQNRRKRTSWNFANTQHYRQSQTVFMEESLDSSFIPSHDTVDHHCTHPHTASVAKTQQGPGQRDLAS